MPQNDYTYAVARVRFKETQLLSDSDLYQLLSQRDVDTCIRFLHDKGWGDNSKIETVDELLKGEDNKTWKFIDEIIQEDKEILDFFKIPSDFHNLKVAIKSITRDIDAEDMFLYSGTVDPKLIYDCVNKREYERLPEHLYSIADEAMKTILQTSDGQLCDIVIDKACLNSISEIGKNADNEIIKLYCELFVASADIKIAARCAKTKKDISFINRSLAPCDTLNIDRLASCASFGFDSIIEYLSQTEYKSAVSAIETSLSAFEKWCDDYLIDILASQKWEPFTIGPIIAYIIARNNEIKAVRMILFGKINALDDDIIKKRLRKMYV